MQSQSIVAHTLTAEGKQMKKHLPPFIFSYDFTLNSLEIY